MTPTTERARGRWREILMTLGVEERFLAGRHGPCPLCGGKDRFRFTDKDGDGWYFCNQCGPGSGIVLLRKLNKWNHHEACCAVDRVIGSDRRPPQPVRPLRGDDAKLRAVERLLFEANAPHIVTDYLAARGLAVSSPVLRGHRACPYFDEGQCLVGRFPAVIAPIISPDGRLVSCHRIYLADVEPRKKTMQAAASLNGAAVRLHGVSDEMGIGEGVETCLAAHQLFGVPMWAALTANGVRSFVPPAGLMRLHIFADNDANATGQLAAYELVRRLHRTVEAIVNIPAEPDSDWLDVLTERVRQ